jgi:hypothetical protein
VAAGLADVSIEYYSKVERGALAGVSAGVLDAVARALQLDDAERAHLFDLARAADGTSAIVRPRRRKANRLARAFYSPVYDSPQQPPNIARFQFLDPASYEFYPNWDAFADICVAILRTEAGRNPHDKELHDLIGELSTRSDEFRTRWGAHDVRHHSTGSKTFHHPVVASSPIATWSMISSSVASGHCGRKKRVPRPARNAAPRRPRRSTRGHASPPVPYPQRMEWCPVWGVLSGPPRMRVRRVPWIV